jgi:hypothetical protein
MFVIRSTILRQSTSQIYMIRGEKVMLDSDLAGLYGIPTSRLNEQFKRNRDRFPADFAFQMTKEEFESLMSQIEISNARGGAGVGNYLGFSPSTGLPCFRVSCVARKPCRSISALSALNRS